MKARSKSGGPPAGEPPLDEKGAESVAACGARAIAEALARRGFRVIPVRARGKQPVGAAWQRQDTSLASITRRFNETTGDAAGNVGILLTTTLDGRALVDIDLDHPRAVELADEHLPPTGAIFGRASNPRSHRLYVVRGKTRHVARAMPRDLGGTTIAEHRHGAHQSVAPGSIHPTGEHYRWDAAGEPAEVDADTLLGAFDDLVAAVVAAERTARGIPEPPSVLALAGASPAVDEVIPGDEPAPDWYARNGSGHFREALRRAGWSLASSPAGQEYWLRPGKPRGEGHSATLAERDGRGVFHVFSSSAPPFEAGRSVSIFDGLAHLSHGGDRAAAAREVEVLRGDGPIRIRPSTQTTQTPTMTTRDESDWTRLRRQADADREREPFPTSSLPEPLRRYAHELARATGAPVEMGGTGLLVAAAAAIGSTASLEVRPGWRVPAILWGAIVARSGSLKSPVIEACLGHGRRQDLRARERNEVARRKHEQAVACFARDKRAWERDGAGDPPSQPAVPCEERFLVGDATTEALAKILAGNPRGLLLGVDELASLFGSMDRYSGRGRGGADLPFWLSAYEGRSFVKDRVTGGAIAVPTLSISVLGGVQPRTLERLIQDEHLSSGFESRWVYCCPPPWRDGWTDAVVSEETTRAVDRVFDRLYATPAVVAEGRVQPEVLRLDEDALARMRRFVEDNAAARLAEHDDDHHAALAKSKGLAARLALVLHEVKVAAVEGRTPSWRYSVSLGTLESAIALAGWFEQERRRIFGAGIAVRDERAALLRWIRSRPEGRATAAEVARSVRAFKGDAEGAEVALRALAGAGMGAWETSPPTPKGGRPTARFTLRPEYLVSETPAEPAEHEGFSFVDAHGGRSVVA